jgi:hypothetical protein
MWNVNELFEEQNKGIDEVWPGHSQRILLRVAMQIVRPLFFSNRKT